MNAPRVRSLRYAFKTGPARTSCPHIRLAAFTSNSRAAHNGRTKSTAISDAVTTRRNWYRHQWRHNKTGIAIHIAWLSSFVAFWNYALREHLEPYLPKAIQPPGTAPLHPERFRRFDLSSRIPFSQTSSIFTLSVHGPQWVKSERDYEDAWKEGIWSVEIKQPQLMIARAYTPLPPLQAQDESASAVNPTDLRFLIRREKQGEVSGYLHRLPLDADVEVRGPHLEYRIPHDVEEVVFLAGGTGIAPAMQTAYALSRRKLAGDSFGSKKLRMRILWASRTQDDAYGLVEKDGSWKDELGAILAQLKRIEDQGRAAGNLDLQNRCFVDELGTYLKREDVSEAMASPGTNRSHAAGRKLVLVSGPDGLVEYLAGGKEIVGGVQGQGAIRGILSQVDLHGWDVWKL